MTEIIENLGVSRHIRKEVVDLLTDRKADLEAAISSYVGPAPGKKYKISKIWSGRRPSRKLQNFPAITVVGTGRNPTWFASRTTLNPVNLRVFVCVMNDDTETCEDLMSDLTDAVVSLLMQYPRVDWTVLEDDGEGNQVEMTYKLSDAGPTSIVLGEVDEGFVRAAQIDWTGQLLLTHTIFSDMPG